MALWPRRKIRTWGARKESPEFAPTLSAAGMGGVAPGAFPQPRPDYLRCRIFDSNRSISKYIHTSVTMIPNAPYHSMYLGAPA